MIKMNQLMRAFIASRNLINFEELLKLFSLELTQLCGCVVLKDNINRINQFKSVEDIKRSYYDLTDFERSINEIYVNHHYFKAFQDTPYSFQSLMELSFALVFTLSERLKRYYPDKAFQIDLSFDIKEAGEEGDDSATIHFTTKRKGESPLLNVEDIEDFSQPVLVFEVD